MRCKRGNWSAAEKARLRDLLPRCSEQRIAQLLRRSVESVRRRARELCAGPTANGPWTDDEDRVLRVGFGAHSSATLAMLLRRGERDVVARIEHLRGSRRRGPWSGDEMALLKQLYGSRDDDDLEVSLSRSVAQIRRMAEELCLSKDKRFVANGNGNGNGRSAGGGGGGKGKRQRSSMPRWTAAEVERLRALYPHHDNLEIARTLRRTVTSVANKASQLDLRKSSAALREMGRRNVSRRYGK